MCDETAMQQTGDLLSVYHTLDARFPRETCADRQDPGVALRAIVADRVPVIVAHGIALLRRRVAQTQLATEPRQVVLLVGRKNAHFVHDALHMLREETR